MKEIEPKDSGVGPSWRELLTAVGMTIGALAITLSVVWSLGFRSDVALITNAVLTTVLVNWIRESRRKSRR